MEIVPSILSTYLTDFRLKMQAASVFAKRIQVDFVDGKFANNFTITPEEVIAEIEGYRDRLYLEAHLMEELPEKDAYMLAEKGFKKIIMHIESEGPLRDIMYQLSITGTSVGLAVSLETPIRDIEPFVEIIDTILVMTVNPGFGGQKFNSSALNKIWTFNESGYTKEIEVDGGINDKTIAEVVYAKADVAVVGDFLFEEGVPEEQYKKLVDIVS